MFQWEYTLVVFTNFFIFFAICVLKTKVQILRQLYKNICFVFTAISQMNNEILKTYQVCNIITTKYFDLKAFQFTTEIVFAELDQNI